MRIKLKYTFFVVLFVIASVLESFALSREGEVVEVGLFSQSILSGWKEKTFEGNTQYDLNGEDDARYLRAVSDMSASAFYKKIKVDLQKTPYLNWSWRIDEGLPALQERTKQGDDYAARVYVIVKLGVAPWKTRALNYIWSSAEQVQDAWPNVFVDKAMMIPLRSSSDKEGQWQSEKVNVAVDFKNHFGLDVRFIHGVAIMTDTDNSSLSAAAAYGDIFFSES